MRVNRTFRSTIASSVALQRMLWLTSAGFQAECDRQIDLASGEVVVVNPMLTSDLTIQEKMIGGIVPLRWCAGLRINLDYFGSKFEFGLDHDVKFLELYMGFHLQDLEDKERRECFHPFAYPWRNMLFMQPLPTGARPITCDVLVEGYFYPDPRLFVREEMLEELEEEGRVWTRKDLWIEKMNVACKKQVVVSDGLRVGEVVDEFLRRRKRWENGGGWGSDAGWKVLYERSTEKGIRRWFKDGLS